VTRGCRSVVLGDARLSIARSAKRFDAIILDAFSSDAIPVHLLTREAVDVYLQHLNPGGVLMFHISNRYLQLGPLIGALAHDRGLAAVEQLQPTKEADVSAGWYASDWVVVSSDRAAIDALASDRHWTPLAPAPNARLWTDDYSNIVALLKLRR
jgi:spermidine synthase